MKKMIEKKRDKIAKHLFNGTYKELLQNHKNCVNAILKVDFNYWIEK